MTDHQPITDAVHFCDEFPLVRVVEVNGKALVLSHEFIRLVDRVRDAMMEKDGDREYKPKLTMGM